ncbi:MAG: AraC family transcriptional regulator, partial [Bacteroidota bacterium]
NTSYRLSPGHLYLIPSFAYCRYRCEHAMEQYYLHFLEESYEGMSVFDQYGFSYEAKSRPGDAQLWERLLALNPNRELIDDNPSSYDNPPSLLSFKEKNKEQTPAVYLETKGIIRILLSRFLMDESPYAASHSAAHRKVIDSIKHIHEHLHDELSVIYLATYCHLHPDYYSRVFFEIVKVRPLKYIQTKRIERAQLLLSTTTKSLQEIADQVGLGNISYFSRLFKKMTGKTPGHFRNQNWNY